MRSLPPSPLSSLPRPLDDDLSEDDDAGATPKVVASVEALAGRPCVGCGVGLCRHGALLSIVLGFGDAPRCPTCFGEALATSRAELMRNAYAHISRRTCFARALEEANAREGFGSGAQCIFVLAAAATTTSSDAQPATAPAPALATEPVANWDAGDMSCGDLVLELRTRLLRLAPGAVLRVRATDPAAPLDIPAWCGMTGHALIDHPAPHHYDIRRRNT